MHFFSEVCGMELKAFYWMHGAEGAYHAFFEMNEHSSAAIVFNPARVGNTFTNRDFFGVQNTPGNVEHLSFNVSSEDDLLAMNDRLRSKGYMTFGPIDHGMFKSIYVPYAVNDGIIFEFSTNTGGFDDGDWIDMDTVRHAGFTEEDVKRWRKPETFSRQGGAVGNPQWNKKLQPGMREEELYLLSNPEVLAKMEEGLAEAGNTFGALLQSRKK